MAFNAKSKWSMHCIRHQFLFAAVVVIPHFEIRPRFLMKQIVPGRVVFCFRSPNSLFAAFSSLPPAVSQAFCALVLLMAHSHLNSCWGMVSLQHMGLGLIFILIYV